MRTDASPCSPAVSFFCVGALLRPFLVGKPGDFYLREAGCCFLWCLVQPSQPPPAPSPTGHTWWNPCVGNTNICSLKILCFLFVQRDLGMQSTLTLKGKPQLSGKGLIVFFSFLNVIFPVCQKQSFHDMHSLRNFKVRSVNMRNERLALI